MLSGLGYRTVAIDHVLEETVFESKKKKKKGEPRDNTDLVPPPRNIANLIKHACTSLEVDIITFNPEGTNRVRFNRKMYNMAAERGTYFELMYAPSIRDATARKNTISMAHMYHAYGKSKVNEHLCYLCTHWFEKTWTRLGWHAGQGINLIWRS
uniref:Uncharacterized protein n=1 Tax=Timema genevievae TaxID=629358 RepID=A0A7R9PLF9_TIMGE|nr:unnamed protein product [Timema genevievae]